MINRSKDLRNLFRQSLINARKYPKVNYGGYVSPSRINIFSKNNDVIVYFYEWSDLSRPPRTFYGLDFFKTFLEASGIHLEHYQEEIIKSLKTVYVTCFPRTRILNIRSTYTNLLNDLREHNERLKSPKIEAPKIILENQNIWRESEGGFFG